MPGVDAEVPGRGGSFEYLGINTALPGRRLGDPVNLRVELLFNPDVLPIVSFGTMSVLEPTSSSRR